MSNVLEFKRSFTLPELRERGWPDVVLDTLHDGPHPAGDVFDTEASIEFAQIKALNEFVPDLVRDAVDRLNSA